MDTFSAIRAFITTVDTGSFSQAARELGTSKATVSKQVAALEDHLRVRLLHRTTRKLNLTDEGHIYVERARRILDDLSDAEDAVLPLGAQPRGRLRISAPHDFGTIHLAEALAVFLGRFPLIRMEIDFSDRLVDLVDEGFDVAIRISRMDDSSLIARRIAPIDMALCAAPGYWKKYGKPTHPRELSTHNAIMYLYLKTPGEWFFCDPTAQTNAPFGVKVGTNLTTNNGGISCSAAVQGVGIFYGPAYIVREALQNGKLESALESFYNAPLGVYAVYPSRKNLSPKVRVFIDFLVEWFHYTSAL